MVIKFDIYWFFYNNEVKLLTCVHKYTHTVFLFYFNNIISTKKLFSLIKLQKNLSKTAIKLLKFVRLLFKQTSSLLIIVYG